MDVENNVGSQSVYFSHLSGVASWLQACQWVDAVELPAACVVRTAGGRTFNVEPAMDLDCAVIGFTERETDARQVRSLLLGMLRADGAWQVVGAVGNIGADDRRRMLHDELASPHVAADHRVASSSGAIYRFVEPSLVVEVRCTDLQTEDSQGEAIERWTLAHGNEGWARVGRVPGASILHPVVQRIRTDESATRPDVRLEQLSERVAVPELDRSATPVRLQASTVIRREVYKKETRGRVAVSKILVWKTNKEGLDPDFLAYVIHWTDYSERRKEPLKRDVRPAPSLEEAVRIAERMLEEGIKRGWKAV